MAGERDNRPGNDVPSFTAELGSRLSSVIDAIGSQKAAASIAGVSDEQLGRWKSGKARPSFFGMQALAQAAGVSLDWLATGEGPMRPSDSSADSGGSGGASGAQAGGEGGEALPPPLIDAELLQMADEFIRTRTKKHKIRWKSEEMKYEVMAQVARMGHYGRILVEEPDNKEALKVYNKLQEELGEMFARAGTRR